MLVIIGGFAFWFGCSLLTFFHFFLLFTFLNFKILIILFYFILFIYFLPFLLSHVADRILVLQPDVRPEPLRWESQVQDTGPPETFRPHVISIRKSSPRDLQLNAKTQLNPSASKLQCWTPQAKQLAKQECNPTH